MQIASLILIDKWSVLIGAILVLLGPGRVSKPKSIEGDILFELHMSVKCSMTHSGMRNL